MRIRSIWSIARLCIALIWPSCGGNPSRFVNVKGKESGSGLCNVIMIFTVDILSICSSPPPPLGTFPAIAPCSNSGTPLQFGTVHRDCAWDSGSEVGASSASPSIIQALLSNVSQEKSSGAAWGSARDASPPGIWAIQGNVSQENSSVAVQGDAPCSLDEPVLDHRRQTTSDLLE